VNLVLVSTYKCYVGCLSEIRSAISGWEKAILFITLGVGASHPADRCFLGGNDESVCSRETTAANDLIAGLAS
jgi:hypothetical protein